MFHSSVLLSTNFYFYIPRYRHYVRLFFFFLMIRRPPRSTLFPTRRSSDLPTVFEFLRKERGLPPEETWVVATNKSFSLIGGSKLRGYGDPYAGNVILPKQLLLEAVQAAVRTNQGPGVEDRNNLAKQMLSALDEGYENYGWQVYDSGRKLTRELKESLSRSLLEYFNDPSVPSSGDELTFFMTKEIMNRFSPSLLLVNFWDIDIAHYGSYSLYLQAIRRTDRPVYELWQHVRSLPAYRDQATLFVIPEVGRDSDIHGNGFANHRSGDEGCRRDGSRTRCRGCRCRVPLQG